MNKISLIVFASIVVFLTLLGLDAKVQSWLDTSVSSMRGIFVDSSLSVEGFSNKYSAQADTIESLSKQLESEIQKNLILTKEVHRLKQESSAKLGIDLNRTKELNDTENPKNYTIKLNGTLQKVTAVSYVNFKDFSKLYLDYVNIDNKTKGLIYDNHTAGIVVVENTKTVALLNTHEKCGYSVHIGATKVPGVTAGIKHTNKVVVKYIPIWLEVKAGDEVFTSGMDGIFFEGIRVGKVLEVRRQPMYQEAIVEPHQDALKSRVFLMYNAK